MKKRYKNGTIFAMKENSGLFALGELIKADRGMLLINFMKNNFWFTESEVSKTMYEIEPIRRDNNILKKWWDE